MRNRKLIYGSLLALLTVALILGVIVFHSKSAALTVDFLDIGQGDAILISQGGSQILIDGGPSGQVLMEKLGQNIPFWDRKIELVIATHPDSDHIGGLIEVLKKYRVGAMAQIPMESESETFRRLQEVLRQAEEKNQTVKLEGRAGMKIKLASGAEMEILHPLEDGHYSDTNSGSIVAKLVFGQNYFLLTGDLPSEEETKLMEMGYDLSAQVLKVAHHGSKYSTGAEFLEKVRPVDAVISVGQKNRYGHPAPEVLARLSKVGIRIFRTDEAGDVKYVCENINEKCGVAIRGN